MAQRFKQRPSELAGLQGDSYAAWCLDEAIMEYDALVRRGRKLRPRDTSDNDELLRQLGMR